MMKKLALHLGLIFILLFSINDLNAQNRKRGKKFGNGTFGKFVVQASGGWNFASTDLTGVNKSIQLFNENIGQDSQMEEVNMMSGPSAAFTLYGNLAKTPLRMLFDFRFNQKSQKTAAYNPFTELDTQLKVKMQNYSVGVGLVPLETPNFDIGIGVSADYGVISSYLGEVDQDGSRITQDTFWSGSVFMPIMIGFGEHSPLSIGIRPYYQYAFDQVNFEKLNRNLNPLKSNDIPKEQLNSDLHNFGVELHLIFIFSKKEFCY